MRCLSSPDLGSTVLEPRQRVGADARRLSQTAVCLGKPQPDVQSTRTCRRGRDTWGVLTHVLVPKLGCESISIETFNIKSFEGSKEE